MPYGVALLRLGCFFLSFFPLPCLPSSLPSSSSVVSQVLWTLSAALASWEAVPGCTSQFTLSGSDCMCRSWLKNSTNPQYLKIKKIMKWSDLLGSMQRRSEELWSEGFWARSPFIPSPGLPAGIATSFMVQVYWVTKHNNVHHCWDFYDCLIHLWTIISFFQHPLLSSLNFLQQFHFLQHFADFTNVTKCWKTALFMQLLPMASIFQTLLGVTSISVHRGPIFFSKLLLILSWSTAVLILRIKMGDWLRLPRSLSQLHTAGPIQQSKAQRWFAPWTLADPLYFLLSLNSKPQ